MEPEVSPQKRGAALNILYNLIYDARERLRQVPGMAEQREEIASSNLRALERLAANPQDHEVLRELAVNWRLVAETRSHSLRRSAPPDWTRGGEAILTGSNPRLHDCAASDLSGEKTTRELQLRI